MLNYFTIFPVIISSSQCDKSYSCICLTTWPSSNFLKILIGKGANIFVIDYENFEKYKFMEQTKGSSATLERYWATSLDLLTSNYSRHRNYVRFHSHNLEQSLCLLLLDFGIKTFSHISSGQCCIQQDKFHHSVITKAILTKFLISSENSILC